MAATSQHVVRQPRSCSRCSKYSLVESQRCRGYSLPAAAVVTNARVLTVAAATGANSSITANLFHLSFAVVTLLLQDDVTDIVVRKFRFHNMFEL